MEHLETLEIPFLSHCISITIYIWDTQCFLNHHTYRHTAQQHLLFSKLLHFVKAVPHRKNISGL